MDEYGKEEVMEVMKSRLLFFKLHEHSFSIATSSFLHYLFTATQRFHEHQILI